MATLASLISKYLPGVLKEKAYDILGYAGRSKPHEISDEIMAFIEKFHDREPLNEEDINNFIAELNKITDYNVRKVVNGIVANIAHDIYMSSESHFTSLAKEVDDALEKGSLSLEAQGKLDHQYKGFLNYLAIVRLLSLQENGIVTSNRLAEMYTDAGLAVNLLVLTQKISTDASYAGLTFTEPFYPIGYRPSIELQRGIKNSQEYYPYKRINKMFPGEPGDNTYLATNGKKQLYVRCVRYYSPAAILASKIATFVSKEHFSSERLLNNRLAASRKLTQYRFHFWTHGINKKIKKYVRSKKVIKGSGILDEVTNFVREKDPNLENIGITSANIETAHLSKIDFDRCNLTEKLTKKNYAKNMFKRGIYDNASFVDRNKEYLHEKLRTRLKLSILTESFFDESAKKAFLNTAQKEHTEAVEELVRRTKIAFAVFLDHYAAKKFLLNNPYILHDLMMESIVYIRRHFVESIQDAMIDSMLERINQTIIPEIQSQLNVVMPEMDKTEIDNNENPNQDKRHTKDEKLLILTLNQYLLDRWNEAATKSKQPLQNPESIKAVKREHVPLPFSD